MNVVLFLALVGLVVAGVWMGQRLAEANRAGREKGWWL